MIANLYSSLVTFQMQGSALRRVWRLPGTSVRLMLELALANKEGLILLQMRKPRHGDITSLSSDSPQFLFSSLHDLKVFAGEMLNLIFGMCIE